MVVLYKIGYALQKGSLKPYIKSTSCSWNKSTKRDVEPKKIKDIRKNKIRSKSNNEELQSFTKHLKLTLVFM